MTIREVDASEISKCVERLCLEATRELGDDMIAALENALRQEESPLGRETLRRIVENADIAKKEKISLCQDAGMAVVFISLGQDVHVAGGDLNAAINEGVKEGYRKGFLRSSTLDPVYRIPFEYNTPAIIHLEIVPGDKVEIRVLPKGFGGENMSKVALFEPAVGIEGAKRYVVDRVREAGANACPPMIVGVGLGGNLEKCALMAKKSLLRPVGQPHPDPKIAEIEKDLLKAVNQTGIGPQGYGGRITALAVHIETYPTHIGSLPVAVNLQCHSHRYRAAII